MLENILAVLAFLIVILGGSFFCWLLMHDGKEYRDEEKKTRYVILKDEDK